MKISYFVFLMFLCSLKGFAQSGNAIFLPPGGIMTTDDQQVDSNDCECKYEHMVVNKHRLEGYTDKVSYSPGEMLKLYAHAFKKKLKVQLMHHLIKDEVINTIQRVKTKKQNYSTCSFKYGCNWQPNLYLKLADDLPSGYYSLRLGKRENRSFYCSFVIKPNVVSDQKILVIASTNTWQAYNDWGGASFYKFENNNPCKLRFAEFVSSQRPNPMPVNEKYAAAHLINAELLITKWLEANQYAYDVISDDDLDKDSSILSAYKIVIISTHSEYWTEGMFDHVSAYVNNGGHLMYLSGNGMYWKVTKQNDIMECRKLNEIHTQNGIIGGRWRESGRPESAVLGVQYTTPGIATYAPYKVLLPDHWIFNSTGVSLNSLFGQVSITGTETQTGASGHETDKVTPFSPTGIEVIAHGTNPSVADSTDFGNGGADMTYYTNPAGGAVFSVGSISFGGSLQVDSVCSMITKNVIEHFLHP